MTTVYKSKIDCWLGAVLLAAMLASIIAALQTLSANSSDSVLLAALIGVPGFFFPLIALITTRYVIRDDQLIVRCGVFKWRIAISEISSIVPSHDPIASPALSLDRLRITYGQAKSLLISPRGKDKFMQQLAALRSSV